MTAVCICAINQHVIHYGLWCPDKLFTARGVEYRDIGRLVRTGKIEHTRSGAKVEQQMIAVVRPVGRLQGGRTEQARCPVRLQVKQIECGVVAFLDQVDNTRTVGSQQNVYDCGLRKERLPVE